MTILFVLSDVEFFLSHRLRLAVVAQAAGHKVVIAVPKIAETEGLENYGFHICRYNLVRSSKNPLSEIRSFVSLYRLMKSQRPDVAHLITAKPIFYGGVAARMLGIPVLAALTGLGYVYTHETLKTRFLRAMIAPIFRLALNHRRCHALFQNSEDQALMRKAGFIKKATTSLIGGSGVDLDQITPESLPDGPPVVLLPARMLWDKGIREFVEAADLLRRDGVEAKFCLRGDPDPNNPTSVTVEQLKQWDAHGNVSWQPHTSDINGALAACHIVALPSYREGFPKTLIDAAAAGRAAVASDVPGCRDAIVVGRTGYLCAARDARSLAQQLARLIDDPVRVARMGAAARAHAEAHYDIRAVCAAHIELYLDLAARKS